MAEYLSSDKINVFPSTRRIYSQDFSAKLMTELSIARSINMLMDTEGFVISKNLGANFQINIHGYYFQIENSSYIISLFSGQTGVTSIYASIIIETSTQYPELRVPAELVPEITPEAYNTATTYTPGQLCTYNDNQYQCIRQTTGTFKSADWVQLVNNFQGLIFTSNTPPSLSSILGNNTANFNLYTLRILDFVDGNWIIPDASKLWLDISEIDGGVI